MLNYCLKPRYRQIHRFGIVVPAKRDVTVVCITLGNKSLAQPATSRQLLQRWQERRVQQEARETSAATRQHRAVIAQRLDNYLLAPEVAEEFVLCKDIAGTEEAHTTHHTGFIKQTILL